MIKEDYKLSPIVNIDIKEVKNIPTNEIMEDPTWQKVTKSMTKHNCAINTFFDKNIEPAEGGPDLYDLRLILVSVYQINAFSSM